MEEDLQIATVVGGWWSCSCEQTIFGQARKRNCGGSIERKAEVVDQISRLQ
jgi:hypothetical protein